MFSVFGGPFLLSLYFELTPGECLENVNLVVVIDGVREIATIVNNLLTDEDVDMLPQAALVVEQIVPDAGELPLEVVEHRGDGRAIGLALGRSRALMRELTGEQNCRHGWFVICVEK